MCFRFFGCQIDIFVLYIFFLMCGLKSDLKIAGRRFHMGSKSERKSGWVGVYVCVCMHVSVHLCAHASICVFVICVIL